MIDRSPVRMMYEDYGDAPVDTFAQEEPMSEDELKTILSDALVSSQKSGDFTGFNQALNSNKVSEQDLMGMFGGVDQNAVDFYKQNYGVDFYDEPTAQAIAQTVTPSTSTTSATTDASSSGSLADQIRTLYKDYGDWNQGGVDRAQELADLLSKQGVTDVSNLGVNVGAGGTQIKFGDKNVGFAGDYNLDNTYGSKASEYLKDNNLIGWSARGEGNVGYKVGVTPDGKIFLYPEWGSSSDAAQARQLALMAGLAFIPGAQGLAGSIGTTLGATAGSAAATAIGNAVISGGLTALRGGDLKDVLKSAAAGGIGSYAGQAVGQYAGQAGNAVADLVGEGAAGNFLADATKGAIQGGVRGAVGSAITGQGSIGDSLIAGAMGGATGEALKGYINSNETLKGLPDPVKSAILAGASAGARTGDRDAALTAALNNFVGSAIKGSEIGKTVSKELEDFKKQGIEAIKGVFASADTSGQDLADLFGRSSDLNESLRALYPGGPATASTEGGALYQDTYGINVPSSYVDPGTEEGIGRGFSFDEQGRRVYTDEEGYRVRAPEGQLTPIGGGFFIDDKGFVQDRSMPDFVDPIQQELDAAKEAERIAARDAKLAEVQQNAVVRDANGVIIKASKDGEYIDLPDGRYIDHLGHVYNQDGSPWLPGASDVETERAPTAEQVRIEKSRGQGDTFETYDPGPLEEGRQRVEIEEGRDRIKWFGSDIFDEPTYTRPKEASQRVDVTGKKYPTDPLELTPGLNLDTSGLYEELPDLLGPLEYEDESETTTDDVIIPGLTIDEPNKPNLDPIVLDPEDPLVVPDIDLNLPDLDPLITGGGGGGGGGGGAKKPAATTGSTTNNYYNNERNLEFGPNAAQMYFYLEEQRRKEIDRIAQLVAEQEERENQERDVAKALAYIFGTRKA